MKARLLIYFLLFQGIALGQSLFKFEHLTVNEGLSHSDAMAVVQDDEGFIWVGTNKGLDRYDGYTLKNYRLPYRNVNGQYTNRVLGLHLSSDKTLWVVAETQGIFFYDPKVDDFKNLADFARDKKEEETLRQIVARSLTTTRNHLYRNQHTGIIYHQERSKPKNHFPKKYSFPLPRDERPHLCPCSGC